MRFIDKKHEALYNELCGKMQYLDCYHRSLAYLLTLDRVLREHIDSVYDIKNDNIIPDGLHKAWQTDTSRKTTRLAFNLWSGYCYDGEMYVDEKGYTCDLPSRRFAVDEIFCCSYAPYYWGAIKLRFELERF